MNFHMNQIFELKIINTLSNQTLSVTGIEIESTTGNFFIGYGHVPLISIIKKNSLFTYHLSDGSSVRKQINGGIFKVSENKALALLDS